MSTGRLLLAVLLATLIVPGGARAGTYTMNQCQADPARAVSVNWALFGTWNGRWFNDCTLSGGRFGVVSADMDYNTVAGMQITVPDSRPHVTIAHVFVDVATAGEILDPSFCCGNQYSFFWLVASGQTVFEQEMGAWRQAIDRDTPASRDLEAAIYCSYGNGPQACHWQGGPLIGISQLRLTLQESDPPTARATGGTLLSGGTLGGNQTLSYTATDGDSGIRDVAVQIGAAAVGTDGYGDRCANNDWNACPLREDRGDMPIDTTRVPDGTYPLKFVVTDAAGNTATVDSGRAVTINNARANGPGAERKTINVQLVLGQGQSRALRTIYGRKLVITGQAVGSDGNPVTNAPVNVSAQIAQAGQDFTDVGQTNTDGDGAFAFAVPPGPNRTLRLSYTSPASADVEARGQTDVVLQVRAAAHLTVSDHKVAGGRRVTFRGQLKGGPLPAAGVPIGFRGQVGKHTRKFGDTQTDDRGRFHLTYKMPAAGPRKATYPIWVRIGADGDTYPYLPGLSNRVRVTVLR
ncbi:MAG: hypothetical protein ACJ76K_08805 [Solirubrobacteraceae bacterium]